MATTIVPTEEKTNGFRLLSLVIDGGTLVLRHQFDQAIPPETLQNKLADVTVRTKLDNLKKRGKINGDQWHRLFPQAGEPDSAKFDISLLTCLLHHICDLNEHSRAWQGIPSSMDCSLEADIQKMRIWRNEISHSKSISSSDQTFLYKWSEIEQVIIRLGKGIPTLSHDIQTLKVSSIDPVKEKYYQEKLKESNEIDNITTKVREIESNVQHIKQTLEDTNIQQQDLHLRQTHLEQKLTEDRDNRDVQHKIIRDRLGESETKARQLEESIVQLSGDKMHRVSSKLAGLHSLTRLYIEDAHRDEIYVETSAHIKAKKTLTKTHCLILTGLPGEGKTTTATKLISEISDVNCVLKLREPSDWKYLDIGKDQFNIILIDDIFGAGAFDENLHQGWTKLLPEIEKAISAKKMSVVITTRHYILAEAKEKMRRLRLFNDENVVVLDSTTLTLSERMQLLKNHLQKADKESSPGFISKCNSIYDSSFSSTSYQYIPVHNFDTSAYIWGGKRIGFPEIVNIFAKTDRLYKQGASFFEKPVAFFKVCTEDLFLDEDKYLALILIWCRPHQELQLNDLMSADIENTIRIFSFELKGALLNVLRKSLKYHSGGFLQFHSKTGTYSFCHNIVKDMVGLVAGLEYPEAVLQFANEEFIQQYVTTNKENDDGFHLYIDEFRHECLRKRLCADILLKSPLYDSDDTYLFGRQLDYFYQLCITPVFCGKHFNTTIISHDCFSNRSFVASFYQSSEGKEIVSKPVASLSAGLTATYRLILPRENHPIFLPTLALHMGNSTLLEEFLLLDFVQTSYISSQFLEMSLLLAVSKGIVSCVLKLLAYGAAVSEKAILIASFKEHNILLDILLERRGPNYKADYSDIGDGNSPLIAAAAHGSVSSVRRLIDHKVDVNYRNNSNISALSKAVIHGELEVCKILLENGAFVNVKEGKFKRTPLHIVADLDRRKKTKELIAITRLLIQYEASVFMKDYRGHYPIHCAAIRNHCEIVEALLQADISQASLKIKSQGKTSAIKGMDLFHIAVWKNNPKLVDLLLRYDICPNVQDLYGRTPFYRSVYDGKQQIAEKLFGVANIQQSEKTGYTPLHAAVRNGNITLVKRICPHVDINTKDKFGKTPIHTACETMNIEVFRILTQDYRADVRMRTDKGQTIFDILQSKKSHLRKEKSLIQKKLFDQFQQIVACVDNEFAKNFELLPFSWRITCSSEMNKK